MITPTNWLPLITQANTSIREAWSWLPVEYPLYTTTVTMGGDKGRSIWEDAWIGRMPKMRLWSGPRVYNEPNPQTYSVVVEPFELTYTLDRFRFDDDGFGVFYPLLLDMAMQTKLWPEYQVRDLIEATGAWSSATSQAGLDGLSNWNTAHQTNVYSLSTGSLNAGTAYCNDFTGGGQTINSVTVGGAFSQTSVLTLMEYMMTIRGEDGERLMITPTHVMVPPTLAGEAEYVLKNMLGAASVGYTTWGAAQTQVGAIDNVTKRFGMELHINKNLASFTKFYMMDCSKAVKPFRWISRDPPAVTPRVNENDPLVFDSHLYTWGAWARGAPAWSPAWLAARSGP
jgi:phage major head subunit gpT-like protein